MGVLAGYPLQEVRRAIQHGQPQMTIADLLGNPLPGGPRRARRAWRTSASPGASGSACGSRSSTSTTASPPAPSRRCSRVMADNYAEILDQIYECPEAAWYLTANDDAGGGTYQVIEALRDRIDIVVQGAALQHRASSASCSPASRRTSSPRRSCRREIIFTEDELDRDAPGDPGGGGARGAPAPARVLRQPVRVLRARRAASSSTRPRTRPSSPAIDFERLSPGDRARTR